ncbi:MAG TPA: NrsF family protein [Methylovirgula sp.]|nr:NrsF family protein [Methylovirgula sp.]
MKTDDLIRVLAADPEVGRTPLALALVYGLLPGIAVSLVLYALLLGPRPHLLELVMEPRILFKIVYPLALFACAAPLALQLARPTGDPRPLLSVLLLLLLVLAAAVAAELVVLPHELWRVRLLGHNALFCMVVIPSLAAAPLVGALVALQRGAPTNPTLAGAGAGLLAGAFAAGLYATHCPDDSPLFVATWYVLTILIVMSVGAIAGSRFLRW